MQLLNTLQIISDWVLGWPMIIYVMGISIVCTIALGAIQFRHFFTSWKKTLFSSSDAGAQSAGDMSPIQAFINTLSTNLGNGSIAGMAVAVFTGGPGAGFWLLVVGLLLTSVRFAEVYISTLYGANAPTNTTLGGPMLYLKSVVGGEFLSYAYGVSCLIFGFMVGNAMQANSICISLTSTWPVIMNEAVAVAMVAFVLYVVWGGAARIVKVSDAIVPVKVFVFFGASIALLAYHYAAIIPALQLIFTSAFYPVAPIGALMGFSVQQAIQVGMTQYIVATESGLGTAAILFGFTGSKDPMASGMMGMVSSFVSTVVCFLVVLSIVASGVWHSGANSTALTIQAFNTLFGQYGGWIVSFLSVSFGMGVLVSYAYITRAAWLFVTGGRWSFAFTIVYALCAGLGALVDVKVLWSGIALINAAMLFINLFGVVYLLAKIRKQVLEYRA